MPTPRAVVAALLLVALSAWAAKDGVARVGDSVGDVTLSDLSDREVPLRRYAGKVVVLVAADREGKDEDQRLKDRLGVVQEQHPDAMVLVALADVAAWNFWPARRYVKDALRQVEAEGATVLVDWTGITRRRLGLRPKENAVVVVSPTGVLEVVHRGSISPSEAQALLARVERSLPGRSPPGRSPGASPSPSAGH